VINRFPLDLLQFGAKSRLKKHLRQLSSMYFCAARSLVFLHWTRCPPRVYVRSIAADRLSIWLVARLIERKPDFHVHPSIFLSRRRFVAISAHDRWVSQARFDLIYSAQRQTSLTGLRTMRTGQVLELLIDRKIQIAGFQWFMFAHSLLLSSAIFSLVLSHWKRFRLVWTTGSAI